MVDTGLDLPPLYDAVFMGLVGRDLLKSNDCPACLLEHFQEL